MEVISNSKEILPTKRIAALNKRVQLTSYHAELDYVSILSNYYIFN